ncbi:MAG: GNAT family N-acetyltransferase [Proteobacteria bacterium]|nr:GNAT family N-acetyltransferase [Pseudomonadota bacterium]
MKIRKPSPQDYPKVSALLRQAFPGSTYEEKLFTNLHTNGKQLHEWVCIHTNKIIAYIAFSNAYAQKKVCGLHLAPLAVASQFQTQGIRDELLRFSLRQDVIKENTLFVLGAPHIYQPYGFEPCDMPLCPFDKQNTHFLSIRNKTTIQFTVGYEPEFRTGKGLPIDGSCKKKKRL